MWKSVHRESNPGSHPTQMHVGEALKECLPYVVPGVGFEPTCVSASVFETDVSALPPPGQQTKQIIAHPWRAAAFASAFMQPSANGMSFPVSDLKSAFAPLRNLGERQRTSL